MAAMTKTSPILISGNLIFQSPVTVNLHLGINDASEDETPARPVDVDHLPVVKSKVGDFKKHKNAQTYYQITGYPKGRVLLINNNKFRRRRETEGTKEKEFHGVSERKGSLKDLNDMTELWLQVGCSVTIETDLTADNVQKAVENFSAVTDDASFYVVMLMSHGRVNDKFVGTQDGDIPVKTIVNAIIGSKPMKSKPKLIFLQMCRGTKYRLTTEVDSEVFSDDESEVDDGTWIRSLLDTMLHLRIQTDDSSGEYLQDTKDLMLAFATQPDEVAFRDIVAGSWFIQSIRKVFSKYAANCDVKKLMEMVKKDLEKREVKESGSKYHKAKTVMDYDQTFGDKILRLFPGFPNPENE